MTIEEIKEQVFANRIQIDNEAILLSEAIFEDNIKTNDKYAPVKEAAYWITIGMMLSNKTNRLPDGTFD